MKRSRSSDDEDDQQGDHGDNSHVNKKTTKSKTDKHSRPSTEVNIAGDDEASTRRKHTTTTTTTTTTISPPSTTKSLKHPRSDSGDATEKREEPSKIQRCSSRNSQSAFNLGRHNLEISNKSGYDTNATGSDDEDDDEDEEYEEHGAGGEDD